MPTISMFYGIIIRMFYRDNKQHNLPHIHAESRVRLPFSQLRMGLFLMDRYRHLRGNWLKHGLKSTVTTFLPIGTWR